SRIKRGEHSFANPAQLEKLLRDAGFDAVEVQTVVQIIVFPSVLDYVRFQLLATPMTVILKDKVEAERQAIISSVASKTRSSSTATCSTVISLRFRRKRTSLWHGPLAMSVDGTKRKSRRAQSMSAFGGKADIA